MSSAGSSGAGKRVLLGRIVAAHGIRGEVLVKSYTGEPEAIGRYGPLQDTAASRTYKLKVLRVTPKGVIARVEGVADRTAAEALKGTDLHVSRERLPPAEAGEYYHADLIGLTAVGAVGEVLGEVVGVHNFGAGDLIEIRLAGSRNTELVAFKDAFVPEVDIAGGRLTVLLPAADAEQDDGADDAGGGESAPPSASVRPRRV